MAYEPVWAIGTGRVPSNADIEAVHGFIRAELTARFGALAAGVRDPLWRLGQARQCGRDLALENVDGALVGGASLKAEDFLAIIGAA